MNNWNFLNRQNTTTPDRNRSIFDNAEMIRQAEETAARINREIAIENEEREKKQRYDGAGIKYRRKSRRQRKSKKSRKQKKSRKSRKSRKQRKSRK